MEVPPAVSSGSVERAIAFVSGLLDRYTSYHDHKESMAFTGLTLFTGVAGAILVSDKWSPTNWGDYAKLWAFLGITALWAGTLVYLKFQLQRRRWAALRVAGCEQVLAKWIISSPSEEELIPKERGPIEVSCLVKLADFFWPQRATILVLKPPNSDNPPIYPAALVDAWVRQEKRGTDALWHERLIVIAGWAMYILAALFSIR